VHGTPKLFIQKVPLDNKNYNGGICGTAQDLYSLPNEWNNIIPEVKFQQNKTTFKWALKAHLLEDLVEN
jgi:hypothetical protein